MRADAAAASRATSLCQGPRLNCTCRVRPVTGPGGIRNPWTSSGGHWPVISTGVGEEVLFLRGFDESRTEAGFGRETWGPPRGGQEMLEGKGEVKAEQGVSAATWLTQPRCLLRLMPKEDVFTFVVVKIRSG